MSDAEDALAQQIYLIGLPVPEREWRFTGPTGKRRWQVDFCWPDRRVCVELEGGVWKVGRHNSPTGFLKDMDKYNELALAGYTLVRATPAMVDSGAALDLIERALGRGAHE